MWEECFQFDSTKQRKFYPGIYTGFLLGMTLIELYGNSLKLTELSIINKFSLV
jgi:hypothetical protein